MQMYSLKAGRDGILITEDGECRQHATSRPLALISDHIVMDYIRLFNNKRQGIYTTPQTDFDKTAERLASQGYTVFEMPGRETGRRYGFAVIIDETETEMD